MDDTETGTESTNISLTWAVYLNTENVNTFNVMSRGHSLTQTHNLIHTYKYTYKPILTHTKAYTCAHARPQ